MNTLRNLTLSLLAIIALSFIACEKDPVVEPEPAPAPAPEPTPTAIATPITNDFLLGDWELYKVDYFAMLTPDIPESGIAQQISADTFAIEANISLNSDTLFFSIADHEGYFVGDLDVFAHTIGLVEGKINADTLKVNTISGRFHGDNKFDKFDGWSGFTDKNDSTLYIPYSDTLIKIRYYASNDKLILEQTLAGDVTSLLQAKANGYNLAPSTKYIFSEKALAYFRRKAK